MTPRLILVTVSTLEEGRNLAAVLLDQRLAACVNLLPGMESHYRWKGELEHTTEILLLIKSSAELFPQLAEVVRQNHSYECPEIVALNPAEISAAYAAWWSDNLSV